MAGYYIAFHGGKGRAMDVVIAWATRSPYSHCELLRAARMPEPGETHRCIGASLMDGGVRIREIVFDEGKWHFLHVPWAPDDAWERAASRVGSAYDLRAFVWTHLFNFRRHTRDKWFCSELIADALGISMPHAYSPGDLLRLVGDHSTTWNNARRSLGARAGPGG